MGSGQSTASGSDSSGSSGSSSFSDSINGVSYTSNSSPGSKKALIIGINYIGTDSQLNGCINDANTLTPIPVHVNSLISYPVPIVVVNIPTD
jgi:hypothetical protein